jgi:hypothetical protein
VKPGIAPILAILPSSGHCTRRQPSRGAGSWYFVNSLAELASEYEGAMEELIR